MPRDPASSMRAAVKEPAHWFCSFIRRGYDWSKSTDSKIGFNLLTSFSLGWRGKWSWHGAKEHVKKSSAVVFTTDGAATSNHAKTDQVKLYILSMQIFGLEGQWRS
jgi:hypothetical protein